MAPHAAAAFAVIPAVTLFTPAPLRCCTARPRDSTPLSRAGAVSARRRIQMMSLVDDVRDYGTLVGELLTRLSVTFIALLCSPAVFILERRATHETRQLANSIRGHNEYQRAVLITGASSGIGRALALAYAAHTAPRTAALYLTDIDSDGLQETAVLCRALDSDTRVECVVADVTDADKTKSAIYTADEQERAAGRSTGLDVVIANAGVCFTTTKEKGLDVARKNFDVNLTGTANTVVPAAEIFTRGSTSGVVGEAKSAGSIVIISSLSSYLCGIPLFASYGASKAAQRFYGEALAAGLEACGVDVLVVCPSFVDTPMTEGKGLQTIPPEKIAAKVVAAVDQRGVGVLDLVEGNLSNYPLYSVSHLPLAFRRSISRLVVQKACDGSPELFAQDAN